MLDDEGLEASDRIPTNLRILLIIEKIVGLGTSLSAAQLSEYLGLPKATVHRLLSTAEEQGFLQRDLSGHAFVAGKRLQRIARNTLTSYNAQMQRLAIMTELSNSIGETCNLSIPARDGMIYLERVETKWPLQIRLPIGSKVPYHCTASGKMTLSTLDEKEQDSLLSSLTLDRHTENTVTDLNDLKGDLKICRDQGYAIDNEEFLPSMVAIAVPVLDDRARLLATLSVHAPTSRKSISDLKDHLQDITAAARKIQSLEL